MAKEWRYGDEVHAQGLDDEWITGVIVALDWNEGDEVRAAAVRKADGSVVEVHVFSLCYQTDRNGYAFRYDKRYGELTVLRNDDKLLDPKWVARKGVYLLTDSLAPGRRRKRV